MMLRRAEVHVQGRLPYRKDTRDVAIRPSRLAPLKVAGLFAGVGGIELGLSRAGHEAIVLCENDPGASEILRTHFPQVPMANDVREIRDLPAQTELLSAGFPCQDLSQAGRTAGIGGEQSGLVGEVFRLLRNQPVPIVLIENVPFMLSLNRGAAMRRIVDEFEALGYRWAYRVIDSRSFGIPQRRERVFFLASLSVDPRSVLFADDAGKPSDLDDRPGTSFGFYWTEGVRGLGWAVNSIPTLKGGSTVGIPSPPAILLPDETLVTPELRDAERLQGFTEDWTAPAERVARRGHRWKLIGNAVTVDVLEWLGQRLCSPGSILDVEQAPLSPGAPWPKAAWNVGDGRRSINVSTWPSSVPFIAVDRFLRYPGIPLSAKATSGFLARTASSRLRFPSGFLSAVRRHLERVAEQATSSKSVAIRELAGHSFGRDRASV